jgi:hypothetical protein
MSAVFERYPHGAGEFTLALALADNAHDDGSHIFPSVATMAHKSRQTERNVQTHLAAMRKAGWLLLVRRSGGRGRPAEYRINPAWLKGEDISPISPVDNSGPSTQKGEENSIKRVKSTTQKGEIRDTPIRRLLTVIEPNPLPPKGGTSASQSNPQTPRTGNSTAGTGQPVDPRDDGFAAFWQAYPKKVDEGKARTWWAEHKPDAPLQALILTAVRAWCEQDAWQEQRGKFVPKPSNWLRNQRWLDVPGTQVHSPAPKPYVPPPRLEGVPMPPEIRAKLDTMLGLPARQPQAVPCN